MTDLTIAITTVIGTIGAWRIAQEWRIWKLSKIREALRPFAAWPIVANGRIVETDNDWNQLMVNARQALACEYRDK